MRERESVGERERVRESERRAVYCGYIKCKISAGLIYSKERKKIERGGEKERGERERHRGESEKSSFCHG
jgi:hypothetical protein